MLTVELRSVYHILSAQSNLVQRHGFLVTILGATPNYIPLKYRYPGKKSSRIRIVYLRLFLISKQQTLIGMVILFYYN